MSLATAFAESDAAYRAQVMHDTWGHLRAKSRKLYKARIVFTCAGYGGDIVIIDARVQGVADSPWLYRHMMEFVMRKSRRGRISIFEGTYYTFKNGRGVFNGKCRVVKV